MDLDLDPLTGDHPILATVEVDEPRSFCHLALSYDGSAKTARSTTPGSRQVLSRADPAALDGSMQLLGSVASAISSSRSSDRGSTALSYTSLHIDRYQPTYEVVIIPPPRYRFLPYTTSRTGVVYDVRMQLHRHLLEAHPENPFRISAVWQALQDGGLVAKVGEDENEYHLIRLPIRPALESEILLVHSPEHLAWVKALPHIPLDELKVLTQTRESKDSIYVHPDTFLSASMAAGGAIDAVKTVVEEKVRNAIAVIRPPGHHAEHDHASGFCFFNNVCVAAKVAQREYPEKCRKILILDWDVHHGNGVQHAFENDPNVLYISLHVHQNGEFYPQGPDGDHYHCGTGKGLGWNINIPWTHKGMGDAEYVYAFQQVVMPVALEFDPDLVIISAGFDAADGDALGGCFVSPAGYTHMTHMLMQLAKGKVVACLEGGYGFETMGKWNASPVANSALAVTRTLMGEPPERLVDLKLHQSAVRVVREVIRVQSRFWRCLYPKDLDLQRKDRLGSQRLHDIIREWQSKKLWDEHRMSALFIMREKLSKSFENQVLATPNYHEARPVLLIFHDPPEALGYPDPATSQLELHNTWITDVSKTYVDWAVKHEFAVIDVNIPKHITEVEDDSGYEEAAREQARAKATSDVANYLWRNYIEPGDSTHIFLLGVGDAYVGIVELLQNHDSAAYSVTHTFGFTAENVKLRKVDRPSDEGSVYGSLFKQRSSIFVSHEHQAWEMPTKKISRKLGRLVKSPATTLQDMLLAHREEVTGTLWNLTKDFSSANGAAPTLERTEDVLNAATSMIPLAAIANGSLAPPTPVGAILDKDVVMGGDVTL